MKILNRLGIVSLWLAGILLLAIGFNQNDPVLLALRGPGDVVLCAVSIVGALVLLWRRGWRGRGRMTKLLALLWILPPLAMLNEAVGFAICKQIVLRTEPARAKKLGQHFIVGYTSFQEVARLADEGLIGGIYVTRHNVAGRTLEAMRGEIAALQARRQAAHLPPLIVAADQEGGIVSHLSPLLPALPPLSALAGLSPELRARAAEQFGRAHGRSLAALGINLNFAPVLDLRPAAGRNPFDLNTLIEQRAIASDPAVVADIARAYVQGLEASGVEATLKHARRYPSVRCQPRCIAHRSRGLRLASVQGGAGGLERRADDRPCQPHRDRSRPAGLAFQSRHRRAASQAMEFRPPRRH
jgi:beta-N-acetylhexosaminidase